MKELITKEDGWIIHNLWTQISERSGRKAGFKCICGVEKEVDFFDVKYGKSKSCGCHASKLTAERNKRLAKHGMTGTPTYISWQNMKSRCTYTNDPDFHNYGGRGIQVCDRWLSSFENFLKDMGERPKGMTLDRKDPDGDYDPSNCKWSTNVEQQLNRRVRVNSTSQYRGVCMPKRRFRWRASVRVGDKTIQIGTYDSEIEAAKAYDQKVKELGLPNKLNF